MDNLQGTRNEYLEFLKTVKEIIPPQGYNCKIFAGGCMERGVGSSFRARAHAHNHTIDPNFGWLCFRSLKRLKPYFRIVSNDDGTVTIIIDKPSQLLKHEYAHILTPNHGHDKKWAKTLKELGGQIKRKYKHLI